MKRFVALWIVFSWSLTGQTLLKQNYFSKEYIWSRPNGSGVSGELSSTGAGKVLAFAKCPDKLVAGNLIRISGGTGTAENAAITAASCTVGAAGTATITTANTHSGSWVAGTATNGRQEAGAHVANVTWSDYVWAEQAPMPPFDYEAFSLILNNHDYRGNTFTPRGTSVSTGAAALMGWTTPTNAECIGCQAGNEQSVLILSQRHMNTIVPGTVLVMKINPGVDNFNGIWGFNVNTSNNGFSNASATTGIFGGEINIGLDDAATDEPTPGASGRQAIGLAITESSVATTKRVTTGLGIFSAGAQNFHHGIYIQSHIGGATNMDSGITITGKVNTAINLSGTTAHTLNGSILLPNSTFGGIAGMNSAAQEKPLLYVATGGGTTVVASANGGIQFNSGLGTAIAIMDELGGVVPTVIAFAALAAYAATNGRLMYCTDCTHTSTPCSSGGTGAFAKRLNGVWQCN